MHASPAVDTNAKGYVTSEEGASDDLIGVGGADAESVGSHHGTVDDEKTRWAVDVMTAWLDGGQDCAFLRGRIESYLDEGNGPHGLITGLINLNGLLLMGMEIAGGRDGSQILRAIAATVSRGRGSPQA